MRLGTDLARAGFPPRFQPGAVVSGELPASRRAARVQRQRWEHGHLKTLLTEAPRLAAAAVRQRRVDLLGLAAELGVPPLSVLGLLWAAVLTGALVRWHLGGSGFAAQVLLLGGLAMLAGALLAWAKFGRSVLPPAALLAAPWYVVTKLPIYLAFLLRPQRAWVRTERDSPAGAPPDGTAS
jgi:hypothetical protein